MAKNILLLFLSNVRPNDDIKYTNLKGEGTKGSSESAIRWLLQENIKLDKIFILASEMIRKPIKGLEPPQTHLEFFRERMENFCPTADFDVYDFNENNPSDKNLKDVADMAERIQNFAAGEEVVLHVDLTGGMRHVNMLILELTRLLEYSGLTVDKVLYSNFDKKEVEEIQNVYELFQLIAGMEEFVQFGSVTALKNYYADKNLSEPLQKLLASMENFAEAVKLCHYGQFHDAIINLHDAVRDFKPNSDDVQDILMARLIERIRKDYHRLIVNREVDDLEVIRWCLEKGYLQQALTLYTERIPEYLFTKKLLTMREDEFKKLTKARGDDVRNPNFYLLNVYKTEDKEFQSLGKMVSSALSRMQNDYVALIKTIPDALKEKLSFDEWRTRIDKLVEKFCANIKLVSRAPVDKEHIVCADEERLCRQYELLERVNANDFETLSAEELAPLNFFFKQFAGKPAAKKILNAFKQIKGDDVKKFFPKLVCKRNTQIFRLKMMLDAQIFSVTFDEKIFFSVMEKYFRIKTERNQSNHARADDGEFKTAKELRDFMMSGVDELDSVLSK